VGDCVLRRRARQNDAAKLVWSKNSVVRRELAGGFFGVPKLRHHRRAEGLDKPQRMSAVA
jgi:hypothetical protein